MTDKERAVIEAADVLRRVIEYFENIHTRAPWGVLVTDAKAALRDLDAPAVLFCETCGGTKLVPCGCFDKKNCQHIRGLRGCPTCGGAR